MNYIIFMPDEMRADALSCYGNPISKTPNYDKLAEEGVLFEQCHVQNPVCSPSRCCLFTGNYVHVAGHRTLWNLVKPYERNLAGYLKENGYDVRVFGKNDLFSPQSKIDFTNEFKNKYQRLNKDIPKQDNINSSATENIHDFLFKPQESTKEDCQDYANVQAGVEYIKSRKDDDKPFFLFLALSWPHCPYTCFEPYYSMYMNEKLDLKPYGENKPSFHELIRKYRNLNDEETLKKIKAVYLGMVTYMDELLGKVMEALKESGREKDTMLIATSDHGDYAGDYGLVEKWPSGMEDDLTHVPLIIKSPDCKKGHTVREQNEMFDIMATILESAGIELKHTCFAKSLVNQIKGEKGDSERAVFCEGGYNTNELHCNEGNTPTFAQRTPKHIYYPKGLQQREHPESVCRATMMRTLTRKLVMRTDGENEFYDLEKDKDELINRYLDPKYEKEILSMKEQMLNWYISTSDIVPFEYDPR